MCELFPNVGPLSKVAFTQGCNTQIQSAAAILITPFTAIVVNVVKQCLRLKVELHSYALKPCVNAA